MKKRMVTLAIVVFLASIVIGLFLGYLIKMNNIEFGFKILSKELSLKEKLAIKAWENILKIKVLERDTIGRIKAQEKIKLIIENLAAQIKAGKLDYGNIFIEGKDLKKAVMLLNQTSPMVVDKFVGNRDGHCSISELNKFINYPETSFQVGVVRKMIITYSSF